MSRRTIAEREAIAAVASGRAPVGTVKYIREACERVERAAVKAERRRMRKAVERVDVWHVTEEDGAAILRDNAIACIAPEGG